MRIGPGHPDGEEAAVEGHPRRSLPLVFLGLLMLGLVLLWLLFVFFWVAVWPGTPAKWLMAPLSLLVVPCFSFGRQWLLEGLGQTRPMIGRRWRPVAGGIALAAYGAAFVAGPAQVGGDGASTAAHAAFALSLTPAGLLLGVAGAYLIARATPPEFLIRQALILVALSALGTPLTLVAYWSEGVTPPKAVAIPALVTAVLLVRMARSYFQGTLGR